jgi:hypothetical protein
MKSKGLTIRSALLFAASIATTVCTFAACGVNYEFGGDLSDAYPCDDPTYSDYHDDGCVVWRCESGNAIPEDNCPDAGSAQDAGSSARCSGPCVKNAPDGFYAPQAVYVGPSKLWPHEDDCPANVGAFGDLRYTDLRIPSPGCPACICGAIEGSCSPTPDIALNADLCNTPLVSTTNFGGPTNWDGSCSPANAVPANLECPPGSGIPCAQSIVTSPLPAPIQGCKPIPLPVPNATGDKPGWKNVVLSCNSTFKAEGCAEFASQQCFPPLPTESGWSYCVRRKEKGVYSCPDFSDFKHQVLAYLYDSYTDTRACTECTCEASGGTCFGTLRVYKDDTCSTNELLADMLSSDGPACSNFFPPGEALSSKEITDLVYVPGACAPKGGEPVGSVELVTKPQFDEHEPVFTWCCITKPDAESM